MNSNSLESLLQMLHPDPQEAAIAYRQLHTRLARYFSIHRTDDPVDLADQTMDRLASRAEAGNVAIESPASFALGIARHLLQEETRHRIRNERTSRTWNGMAAKIDPWEQERLDHLDECLSSLPASRRQMLEAYYDWHAVGKVQHHRQTAERLGLTLNTLRNRIFRIRGQVEECLRQKMSDALPKINTPSRKPKR